MATVEFAVVLLGVVVVLGLVLAATSVAVAEVRVHEAARAGARSAARGEPGRVVVAAAHRAAPGSHVSIRRDGHRTTVSVRLRPRVLPGLEIPALTVGATSVAETEEP